MNPTRVFLTATVLAFSVHLTSADAPPTRGERAKPIFDGETLDGWEAPPPLLWAVKDGCLTGGDGNKIPYNDFLCTKAPYSNFILHLKIKLTGDPKTGFINSGIQIRTQRNATGHEVCGYQCDYGEPAWYAAIYDEGRRKASSSRIGPRWKAAPMSSRAVTCSARGIAARPPTREPSRREGHPSEGHS